MVVLPTSHEGSHVIDTNISAAMTPPDLAAAIVDSSGDAIIGQTLDGAIVSWNRGAEQLCGYSASEVIGRNIRTLAPDDAGDELAEVVSRVAASGTVQRLDALLCCKDGGLVDVSLTMSPVYGHGGEVTGFSVIGRDITAGKLAQQDLKHRALHDALTGLPNRDLLLDRLHQALFRARRHGDRVALLFLDLDDFKLVNDGLGHLAGDELLVQVARRLSRTVRADDTVARFGGDEFVLVCEVGTAEAATQMGNRLLKAFEAPFPLGRQDVTVTASIGLVLAGRDPTAEGLLQDADTAMYRAKTKGRSRIELFNDSRLESAEARLQTATALRRALEGDQLRVFYQPIVSATDTRPLAVEALVRWQHPDRGLVPPDEFIPLADETGMTIPIGRWVLRRALRERASWQAALPAHPPLRLAVNISACQLADRALVDDITAALADTGAAPDSLILEMTESVLMHDAKALSTLDALHNLGVSLHIDDFGTGHSTLAYLEALPIDILKIDRSFVDGLVTNSDDRSIVTAVIALAGTLSLAVVAEGVETVGQLGVLRELHCDFAQGFLFARPLPYDELVTWFRNQVNEGARP